jgi:hypothetical protein
MKLTVLVIAATLVIAAFADELHHAKVQSSKENPQLVVIKSGKDVVAEVRVMKTGSLNVEAENIVWSAQPGQGKLIYNCKGQGKVELSVEGKPLLTASGDELIIQPLNLTASGR